MKSYTRRNVLGMLGAVMTADGGLMAGPAFFVPTGILVMLGIGLLLGTVTGSAIA